MFVLDDIMMVAGAGVIFLVLVGVRGIRRRRLKKRLREDDEFREKVREALDQQEVQWVVNSVTADSPDGLVQRPVHRVRSWSVD